MNQEVKQLWVAALRSDNYKQGIRNLRIRDNFCCLGVLCDLFDNTLWVGVMGNTGVFTFLDTRAVLPGKVSQWAELGNSQLQEGNPISISISMDDNLSSLIKMNDNGSSFEEIADVIEKYL